MVEIKEVLRLWRAGTKKKRIAAQLTLDVKTVRRYIGAAEGCGLAPGPEPLSDEQVASVVAALSPDTGRPHGDGWQLCEDRARGDRAVVAPAREAVEGPAAVAPARRRRARRDAPPVRRRRARVRSASADDSGSRWQAWRGGSHRHGLDDADRARRRPPAQVRVESPHRMSRATSSSTPAGARARIPRLKRARPRGSSTAACSASSCRTAPKRSCTPPIRASRASSTASLSTRRRAAST